MFNSAKRSWTVWSNTSVLSESFQNGHFEGGVSVAKAWDTSILSENFQNGHFEGGVSVAKPWDFMNRMTQRETTEKNDEKVKDCTNL